MRQFYNKLARHGKGERKTFENAGSLLMEPENCVDALLQEIAYRKQQQRTSDNVLCSERLVQAASCSYVCRIASCLIAN